MSSWILIVFVVEFLALAVVAFFKPDTGLMLYGIGGAILNFGVLMMGG